MIRFLLAGATGWICAIMVIIVLDSMVGIEDPKVPFALGFGLSAFCIWLDYIIGKKGKLIEKDK